MKRSQRKYVKVVKEVRIKAECTRLQSVNFNLSNFSIRSTKARQGREGNEMKGKCGFWFAINVDACDYEKQWAPGEVSDE